MSTAPYPAINETGVLTALEQGFLTELREPLAGWALAAGHEKRFGDWGNEEISWREVSTMKNVVVSMDIPPVGSDSGTTKKRTVVSPIWTKDIQMGGRKLRQMVLSGLDPAVFREQSEAYANALDEFFMAGATVEGTTIKGILNHGGIGTVAGGDWNDPDLLNKDIGVAIANLRKRRQYGPFALVMRPDNSHVFNNFVGTTPLRIGDNLPRGISRLLYTEKSSAIANITDAYVVSEQRANFDIISPLDADGMTFGMGTINAGDADPNAVDRAGNLTMTRIQQANALTTVRTVRFLNIMTIRVNRDDASIGGNRAWAEKVSFTV